MRERMTYSVSANPDQGECGGGRVGVVEGVCVCTIGLLWHVIGLCFHWSVIF